MLKKRIIIIFFFYLTISIVLIFISISQFEFYKKQIDITYKNTTKIIGNVFDKFFQNYRKFSQLNVYPKQNSSHANVGTLVKEIVTDNNLAYLVLKDGDNILLSYGNDTKHIETRKIPSKVPLYFFEKQIIESTFLLNNNSELIIGFRAKQYFDSIKNMRLRVVFTGFLITIGGLLFAFLFFIRKKNFILQKKYDSLDKLYKVVLENLNDAVVVFDSKNKISLKNNKGNELFNSAENENNRVLDFKTSFFSSIFSEFKSKSLQKIENRELGIFSKKNKKHTFLVNMEKMKLSNSNKFDTNEGIIACIRNISQYKEMEKKLFEQKKMDTMESMASGVAHEIRNPLNAVNTILQELKLDFKVSENQDEFIELLSLAYNEIKRINNIIENFINYSKPFMLNLKQVEIINLIQTSFTLLKKNKKLTKNIEFIFENNTNSKLLYIEGDEDGLRSIIFNLLKNAAEAIDLQKEKHFIKISIIFDEFEKNILISIYDNGIGLSEIEKEKIFDYYYTQKQTGLGLGLNISQKIVVAHKGSISAFGEKGKFAEVFIKLPCI